MLLERDPQALNRNMGATMADSQDRRLAEEMLMELQNPNMSKDNMTEEELIKMLSADDESQMMPDEFEAMLADMTEGNPVEQPLEWESMLEGVPEDLEEDTKAEDERAFYDNFIGELSDNSQKKIAKDLIGKVQADLDSRRSWEEAIQSVLKTLGVAQNFDQNKLASMPFEDASQAEYPMLLRAAIQYISRSVPEMLPDKPAKAVIVGETTEEKEQQASRAEAGMNYQLTFLDRGFYNDYRKGELFKCLCGSIFRKLYHDPVKEQNLSRMVKPQDFIIHYEQVSLEDCIRYTHRMYMDNNELKKLQFMGYYADVDVGDGQIIQDRGGITKEIDNMDGYDAARANAESEDLQHEIYEVHCSLDIEGFEDTDEDGEPTGIALPYVVTIHKESSQVLSIRRNWKLDDPKKNKCTWFVHYQFLPGTGFYGFGYAHLIGSLARSSTALLRATLDGTALHMLKGGFKTADAKIDGDKAISPGEFRTIEGTFDDIKKALYPIEFAPPNHQATIGMLQFLDKTVGDMIANTEVMVGSAKNTGPVGTTLALIEQGQKVYTSIHQATHRSFGEELRLLARLNFEYFPEQFEFQSQDGVSFVLREDFDSEAIHIIPVSDPNIASFQQRQAIDQATMQMATQFPQYFKMDKVVRRIMENLNVPALDDIMYSDEEMEQMQEQQSEQQEIDPLEAQMQLQQQKHEGEMQMEELKSQLEQESKAAEEERRAEMTEGDLNNLLLGMTGGGY